MEIMDVVLIVMRVLIGVAGLTLVLWTIDQALRSFVLPRSDRGFLTIKTFHLVRYILTKRFDDNTRYDQKDRVLAMLSPIGMFALPMVWLALIIVGYAAMYCAIRPNLGVWEAIVLSGSSLMTLGFSYQETWLMILLAFTQAALGMMLIALLIGYLPTMYSAFSQREMMVTKLETLAGTPPNPVELITRLNYVQMLNDRDEMKNFWQTWQDWFVQIEENHTTLAPMNFFRSPDPARHWVTASGTLLDAAAIIASSVKIDHALMSAVAIRSGFLSLRTIADYFDLSYSANPKPHDPISIKYEEFIHVLHQLDALGIPLHDDWDDCWDHFAGWRVNYDEVLLQLAYITTAPYTMWSSDRAMQWHPDDVPPEREVGVLEVRPRKHHSDIASDIAESPTF